MQNLIARRRCWWCVVVCCVMALLTVSAFESSGADDTAQREKVRIVLVGDSTVHDNGGWGVAFAALLKPEAKCINMARGGASSKSFFDGGDWKRALEKKPNFVLIQFGHNDQPGKGPDRETDPKTTYREYLQKYIEQARQAGAQPILVTSMARRTFSSDGKITSSLTPYVDAMKDLAAEKKVPVLDLHTRSIQLLERIGPQAAQAFDPKDPQDPKKVDKTHLSTAGAEAMAPLVIEDLSEAVPALREYLPPSKK